MNIYETMRREGMTRHEAIALQAVRRALAEIRDESTDAVARDKLARIDSILARVAATIGLLDRPVRPERDPTEDLEAQACKASREIQKWEARVASLDPKRGATNAEQSNAAAAVEHCLKRRYPAQRGLRVVDLRKLPGGRSKHTFIANLENAVPALPPRIVLRADSSRNSAEESVTCEYPAIRAVFDAGCAAPEPLFLESDRSVLGVPFIAFPFLKGRSAGNLWGAEPDGGRTARALAGTLALLHNVPITAVPGNQKQPARDAVEELLERFERNWMAQRPGTSPIIVAAFAWMRARLDCLSGDALLIHGDAHFSNILMDDERLVCLLDWEFWHPGHPAEDLSYCRPYVEEGLDWSEFVGRYRAAGGPAISDDEMEFFALWASLRNVILAAHIAWRLGQGDDLDLETAAIALSTYPAMEARLASSLAVRLEC